MTLSDFIVLVLALVLVFDSGPGRPGGANRNKRPNYPRPPAPPPPPPATITWPRHADAVEAMHRRYEEEHPDDEL